MDRGLKRGDVWWVDLGEPKGREPGFRRPVIVIQDDLLNESRLETVMVVPLTSNIRRAEAPGNIALSERDTGLRRQSVALVCQVMTVDRELVTERVGTLPRRSVRHLDAGLALALGLAEPPAE